MTLFRIGWQVVEREPGLRPHLERLVDPAPDVVGYHCAQGPAFAPVLGRLAGTSTRADGAQQER
eukprot:SAG22_NODE_3237_length_1840_cov_1.705342_2_plen_64_part_00